MKYKTTRTLLAMAMMSVAVVLNSLGQPVRIQTQAATPGSSSMPSSQPAQRAPMPLLPEPGLPSQSPIPIQPVQPPMQPTPPPIQPSQPPMQPSPIPVLPEPVVPNPAPPVTSQPAQPALIAQSTPIAQPEPIGQPGQAFQYNQPDQPNVNQPNVNQPNVNQPNVNQPNVNQPNVNQPSGFTNRVPEFTN